MAPQRRERGGRGVRIAGGTLRGRLLAVPQRVRPTEGRVREALFSIWADRVDGARFLDLFAGSGAVAIEAASRGALEVLAVESDPRVLRRIGDNLRRCALEGQVQVRRGELPVALEQLPVAVWDLVFADPPYSWDLWTALLAATAPLLADGGELAVECSQRNPPPVEVAELVQVDRRRYGETQLSFYRHGA